MVGNLIPRLASGALEDSVMAEKPTFRFQEETQLCFAFLRASNFRVACTSAQKVRYESESVYIEVTHGERDGEVSIAFGRLAKNEEFSFTLFLRLVNPVLEKELGERMADQPDEIRNCLHQLAEALQSEGKEIISGDNTVFDRMKDVRWWDFQPDALKEKFRS